tara:strand:+ start:1387 stop:1572 length:186 start_codon:yes stop_codon:yes gene_type:complete
MKKRRIKGRLLISEILVECCKCSNVWGLSKLRFDTKEQAVPLIKKHGWKKVDGKWQCREHT